MQDKSFSKIKKQNPVSVIVHGTNVLGNNLAKILLEQGSKAILIDSFDPKSKKQILELKKIGEADFVDLGGLEDLMKNIGRVDYVFYLQSEFLLSNQSFTSKDFLEESNNLNLCLKVAQKYNAKFSLVTSISLSEKLAHSTSTSSSKPSSYSAEELQKYSETLTAEYHDKSKINARILRIGTILGKESNVEKFPPLKQLFEDSVKSDSINIMGEGLDIHYLINLSDLVFGILKLTFSSLTNGEVISLCNNNEYTTLSIAYKLLELNPHATEIKFMPNTEKKPVLHNQYVPAPNANEYDWKQRKSLEGSVSETLETIYEENNKKWKAAPLAPDAYEQKLEEIRRRKTKVRKRGRHTNVVATPTGEILHKLLKPSKNLKQAFAPKNILSKSLIILVLLIIFYFFAYPLISITAGGFSVYRNTTKLSKELSDFNNPMVEKELKSINRNFRNMGNSFEKLRWLFTLTQKTDLYDETSMLLYGLEMGSEGAITFLEGAQPFLLYINEFKPALSFEESLATTTREYTNILRDLEKNSEQIEESAYKISQALQTIRQVNKDVYPNVIKIRLEEVEDFSLKFGEQIDPISNIIKFLPDSLGVNNRKRYLILLQNPGELRSTGGWISSYAIIGIEGGQIRELNVDDVYNLDGELKNQQKVFRPPQDMAEILDVKDIGLSLSNWSPHFPEVAKNAEFFVKESGKAHQIDGVITIDIFLLQDLLNEWEGIYIPGESDLITSENIYEKVFFLHQNFTPGQSQKATFLTNLADEIIRKIFSSDFHENKEILNIFLNALETKNMLVYFDNIKAQQYFSEKSWSGEISASKYNFIPFSIEWNWGANKANLYIEREQRIVAEIINLNEINYQYSLILKNNSISKTYPQGEYKNYLRVYIPENANISSITGFTEDEYSTEYTKGFQVLGGWFDIPTSTTKELKVTYTLEDANVFRTEGNNISIFSKLFKQPGTSRNDLVRIEILYPNNWLILKQDDFDKARVQLIKQIPLDRERTLDLEWSFL